MWKNVFDWMDTEADTEADNGYDIRYESECCGNVRERDIYEAIAEYQLMDEWN